MSGVDWRLGQPNENSVYDMFMSGRSDRLKLDEIERKNRLATEQAARDQIVRQRMRERYDAGDVVGAGMEAAIGGDQKMAATVGDLGRTRMEYGEKGRVALSNVVGSVGSLPYEARRGAIQSAKPTLRSYGLSDAEIDAFDPTDDNIVAVSRLAYDHEMAVDDGREQQEVDLNSRKQDWEENPDRNVVVGGALVGQGSGNVVYRAPEMHDFNPENDLYETPGIDGGGYEGGGETGNLFDDGIIPQESGGRQMGADGRPLTSSAGAIGIAQVMPGTAPEAARLAGLAYDERRYRTDPDYNKALGRAYFNEQVRIFGGDERKGAAAYNAGAGRVRGAVARAQREGGDWLQYMPAETRAYVPSVMRRAGRGGSPQPARETVSGQALASEGGRTASGPRLVRRGTPKPNGGRDAPSGYRWKPDGNLEAIPGGPGAKGRTLPQGEVKRLEAGMTEYVGLSTSADMFRDDYAGIGNGVENTIQGWTGWGDEGQRDWWANFKSTDNIIRNELFGAALTAHEKQAYAETTVGANTHPSEVRRNIARRKQIAENAIARTQRRLMTAGYDRDEVLAATGGREFTERPLTGARSSSGGRAVRVQSIDQARGLPKGTRFVTPDGRVKVR